eukprot:gene9084-10761_t
MTLNTIILLVVKMEINMSGACTPLLEVCLHLVMKVMEMMQIFQTCLSSSRMMTVKMEISMSGGHVPLFMACLRPYRMMRMLVKMKVFFVPETYK